MKSDELISKLDEGRLVEAIAAAERQTSGEIRVCISQRPWDDPLAAARRRFQELGMQKTAQRNGVLIFFVPESRQFAVWGDVGVHEKCGEDCWRGIVDDMVPFLKADRYTDAVVRAIARVGSELARHFPRASDDRDELPNTIVGD